MFQNINISTVIVLCTSYIDGCYAAAFDFLCDNIGSANLEHVAGASSGDINFLSDILNDPVYAELIQVSYLYSCLLSF